MELCRIGDIPPNGSRALRVNGHQLFVLADAAGHPRVFVNRCPHLGVPLQWQDDRFLDKQGNYIICSTHGALFEKDTGLCIHGPCRGQQLIRVTTTVNDGRVMIAEAELELTMQGLP
jgi:nitrite reductase/ring-hydroxylating ferredoxin subunit